MQELSVAEMDGVVYCRIGAETGPRQATTQLPAPRLGNHKMYHNNI